MGDNEQRDVIELVELLLKRSRLLLHKPESQFDERDRMEIDAIDDLLTILEMELPADYFTADKSLERFWARPDVQNLLKQDNMNFVI